MKQIDAFKKETGAVPVVEAAFVFPVVFFVVIALIFFGNVLYQQMRIDAITVRAAEYMASHYANPMLETEEIPKNSTNVNIKPYRFLLGNNEAVTVTKKKVREWTNDLDAGFFGGMKPRVTAIDCDVKNYVVYHKAQVSIKYEIEFLPFNFFNIPPLISSSSATATSAEDPSEFIRNVDMVLDYSEASGLSDKIRQYVGRFME